MKKNRWVRVFRIDTDGITLLLIPWTFFLGTAFGEGLKRYKRLGCMRIEPALSEELTPEIIISKLEDGAPLFWCDYSDFVSDKKVRYIWQLNQSS